MFFQQLYEAMNTDVNVSLVVSKKEGELTLIVTQIAATKEGREITDKIRPLSLKGSSSEIDAAFMDTLKPRMDKISGLISNTSQIDEDIESAKKDAEKAKEKAAAKTSVKKEEKPKKISKKEATKKLNDAKALMGYGKHEEALKAFEELEEISDLDLTKEKELANKWIESKKGIFADQPEEEAKPTPEEHDPFLSQKEIAEETEATDQPGQEEPQFDQVEEVAEVAEEVAETKSDDFDFDVPVL